MQAERKHMLSDKASCQLSLVGLSAETSSTHIIQQLIQQLRAAAQEEHLDI